jgi:hypothetical protein
VGPLASAATSGAGLVQSSVPFRVIHHQYID